MTYMVRLARPAVVYIILKVTLMGVEVVLANPGNLRSKNCSELYNYLN